MRHKIQGNSTIFIRVWNVLEGNIDLLERIFDLSKRQIIEKASYLRSRGYMLPKYDKPGIKKKQYSEEKSN